MYCANTQGFGAECRLNSLAKRLLGGETMSKSKNKQINSSAFRLAKLASAVGIAALAATFAGSAHAGYIQTLGISERTASLGGAVSAISDDFDAFATNPAGAASFRRPMFGLGVRVLSTENLEHNDDIWGDAELDRTIQHANQGVLPGLGLYAPIGSAVTVGLGVSAPYALAGVLSPNQGIARYSAQDIELLTLELNPTMAVRVTPWLDLGVTANVVAFKHMKVAAKLGDGLGNLLQSNTLMEAVGAIANADSGQFGLGAGNAGFANDLLHQDDGNLGILTDNSFGIGLPPHQVEPSFKEFSYTLGAKAKLTDRLTLGVSYREETNMQFGGGAYIPIDMNDDGDIADTVRGEFPLAALDHLIPTLNATLGIPDSATACNALGGTTAGAAAGNCAVTYDETAIRSQWKADIDMPRHAQAGLAYELVPGFLRVSGDVKWTNWASVDGFAHQLDVKLEPGVDAPLCDLLATALPAALGGSVGVLLGATAPGTSISPANCVSNVRNDYSADNNFTYMLGAEVQANKYFSVQVGYGFEEAVFDKSKQDTLVFDSNRQYAGLGVKFDNIDPKTGRGFSFNVGGQLVFFDRGFDPRQSENMGGLSFSPVGGTIGSALSGGIVGNLGLGLNPNVFGTEQGKLGLGFGPNQADSPFGPNQSNAGQEFGGYIWAAGAGAKFIF